jgi:uncharacterized protein YbjT (DUF2867 family)
MTGKFLITGATGTVGGAVLDRLGSADVDLRVLTRGTPTPAAST